MPGRTLFMSSVTRQRPRICCVSGFSRVKMPSRRSREKSIAVTSALVSLATLRRLLCLNPSMLLAHLGHHREDVVPRLLFHEHVIREHASVPADVAEAFD